MTLPQLFDGAFGTYYFSLTGDQTPCELANLTNPDRVLQIHRAYMDAGADAIKTNTFGANPVQFTDAAQLEQIVEAGFSIAQQAVHGTQVQVFADIGGNDTPTASADYLTIARLFIKLGATRFLFETLSAYEDIIPAIAEIKQQIPHAIILVSFAVSQDGYTKRGLFYGALLRAASQNPLIDGAGLNCACGPSHMNSLIKQLQPIGCPLIAMPNAGYPSSLNGRMLFEDNADYFAQKLAELYGQGVSVLGGCCGSAPEHIRLAAKAIADAPAPAVTRQFPSKSGGGIPVAAVPAAKPSRKLTAVEVPAPMDADCSFILSAAAQLKSNGADMITVSDSPLSRTHADSLMTAAKLKREIGIEVMPHLCCRDKNHIALKGGLLAASFEGIDQVLVITGDPPLQSDVRKSQGVFNFNSFDLISFIHSMNQDVFSKKPYRISGALNVNAVNFTKELERAQKKVDMGAQMLLTQPIFDQRAADHFLLAKSKLNCAILAGILPVASYRNAVFLMNEVSGIEIPQHMVDSLKDKTPEQTTELSVAYSMNLIRQIYDTADGFYLMTPLKRIDLVCRILKEIRSMEQ